MGTQFDRKLIWVQGNQSIIRSEINKLLDNGYQLISTGWKELGNKKGMTLYFSKESKE